MRLLVLTSIWPDHGHFRAGQTVLATVLEAFVDSGLEVAVAVAAEGGISEERRVESPVSGVLCLDNHSFSLESLSRSTIGRKIRQLEMAFSSGLEIDYPRFNDVDAAVGEIVAYRPDAVLLFWDTAFEHLLPRLSEANIPCFGYLARPPHAAGFARLPEINSPILRSFVKRQLIAKQKRHIRRMRYLRSAANICALDAAWYSEIGLHSSYVSNTWPDVYGAYWRELRASAEARRDRVNVLANIGGLNATGNKFGLEYFAKSVKPLLTLEADSVVFNICGRFDLPPDIYSLLDQPGIDIRGFVPDIEEEVLGNHIFLLLNNAGPYTGGYTRVVFAFSSGSCLIAHKRLQASMPELDSGVNCLLGESADEIASMIELCVSNPEYRNKLGYAARRKYEKMMKPSFVAEKLIEMMTNA